MVLKLLTGPARALVWVLISVTVFARWMLTRPLGFFALAIGAYCLAPVVSAVDPLSASELATLVADQPRDVSIALGTALLTIVGFVFAFAVANSAWRAQRRTEIRLTSGDEIYDFFREAWNHLLTLEIYAEFLIDVHGSLKAQSLNREELEFKGNEIIRRSPEFTTSRLRLSRMSIEVHALREKHELVLSEQWLALPTLKHAVRYLDEATRAMWFLAPEGAGTSVGGLAFVNECDPKAWSNFVRISEESRLQGGVASSAIRAMFMSDVVKPNSAMVFSLVRTTTDLLRAEKLDQIFKKQDPKQN